jgi:hypothetical protein
MFRRIEVPVLGSCAMLLGGRAMIDSGLPGPNKRIRNYRDGSEFFFTEYGWRKCGHNVLGEIRSNGVIARVIAIKEKDPRIDILYRDRWQVVIHWGGKKNEKTKRKD